jgi:hypothetical protein
LEVRRERGDLGVKGLLDPVLQLIRRLGIKNERFEEGKKDGARDKRGERV